MWIDTHCHLDAPEFDIDRDDVIARAHLAGVACQVVPAIMPATFASAKAAARDCGGAYALGTHPLFVHKAGPAAVTSLRQALRDARDDPRLVAVGEIGLDYFIESMQDEVSKALQESVFVGQLEVAVEAGLPVLMHVRRSADGLLKHLRRFKAEGRPVPGGIAHAFNGSLQQAAAFIDLGFKLGFGGTITFDRALQIRRLAATVPAESIVLETDAPDIPPHWLYVTAEQRATKAQGRNEPAQLPAIARTLAELRGWSIEQTRELTVANALQALPRLRSLLITP